MSNTIEVREKVWGPHPTAPNAQVLLAVPGDVVTADQADAWAVRDDGTFAGAGPTEGAPQATSDAGAATVEAYDPVTADAFPNPSQVDAMGAKDLAAVDKAFSLGVGKMRVADKRIAINGAIEELTLEMAGLEGLSAEEILELEATADDEANGSDD